MKDIPGYEGLYAATKYGDNIPFYTVIKKIGAYFYIGDNHESAIKPETTRYNRV